jgi:hypothetical protein
MYGKMDGIGAEEPDVIVDAIPTGGGFSVQQHQASHGQRKTSSHTNASGYEPRNVPGAYIRSYWQGRGGWPLAIGKSRASVGQ